MNASTTRPVPGRTVRTRNGTTRTAAVPFTRSRAAGLALGALLLLPGCAATAADPAGPGAAATGAVDDRTGPQVAADAADALLAAGAVHVAASVSGDGAGHSYDLHLQGEDVLGSITFGEGRVQLVLTDGRAYAQAPPGVLASFGVPEDVASGVDGAWVVLPVESAEGVATMDLAALAEEVRTPGPTIRDEVRTGQWNGQDVLVVSRSDGGTLTVAAGEPAHPLRIVGPAPDGEVEMVLSRHGQRRTVTAPADAVDLATAGG